MAQATPAPDSDYVMNLLAGLIEPLGRSLPAGIEIVLHDLSQREHSIVAIHGAVTGRTVGDSSIDLLVERITASDSESGRREFECRLADGRRVRCSAIPISDPRGERMAALVINTDVATWETLRHIASSFLGETSLGSLRDTSVRASDGSDSVPVQTPAGAPAGEEISRDLTELADAMVRREIVAVGLPVELMKKQHKLEVVRRLRARGLFGLKDAVELVSRALEVSRFTIYNYLNEIDPSNG